MAFAMIGSHFRRRARQLPPELHNLIPSVHTRAAPVYTPRSRPRVRPAPLDAIDCAEAQLVDGGGERARAAPARPTPPRARIRKRAPSCCSLKRKS
jgi:hypothetical protein